MPINGVMPMSRWNAAAIHASISTFAGLVSAILIFGMWYPRPYAHATGAGELVLLLMGVDLILGPLLTIVVFRSGKPGLRFDLSMIALAQLAAFSYGMSIVVKARPVFIVGAVDRFEVMLANDFEGADISQASRPEFAHLPWTGPRIVGTKLPTDAEGHNALIFSALKGKDLQHLPKYYVPYAEAASGLLAHAKPLAELRRLAPNATRLIDRALANAAATENDVAWLPINAPRGGLTMLIDRKSMQPLTAIEVDPW